MNVAMISPYAAAGAAADGVARSTERLVAALEQLGVRATVIAPAKVGDVMPQHVVVVPRDDRFGLAGGFRAWSVRVHSVLDQLQPALVHGMGLVAPGVAATTWKRSRAVVTAHGNPAWDAFGLYTGPSLRARQALADRLVRRVINAADVVVSVNPDWRVNMPCRPRNFAYIPNIVSDEFRKPRTTTDGCVVLFCGGERPVKGFALLREAWLHVLRRVPEAELIVVGAAGAPPLRRVRFVERADEAAMSRLMRSADVLAVPSVFEVSPVVIAEAWTAGLPVVATAVGGIPAFAGDAVEFVKERTPEGFAASLVSVLHDKVRAGSLAERGHGQSTGFTAHAVAVSHACMYHDLLVPPANASGTRRH